MSLANLKTLQHSLNKFIVGKKFNEVDDLQKMISKCSEVIGNFNDSNATMNKVTE